MTEDIRKIWPVIEQHPRVFYEVAPYHDLYDRALKATGTVSDNQMRRMRFYGIPQAVRAVQNVPGDACEIGCLRGLSAFIAASSFIEVGRKIRFHLCDSFQGLSDFGKLDRPDVPIDEARAKAKLVCDIETVKQNLSGFDFIEYHKGWIPEPFKEISDRRFCYAHIDVDLYEPTHDSLHFIWPRMSHGGVVLLDDYGTRSFPGARVAIAEFFARQKDAYLYEQPSGQAIALKLYRRLFSFFQ